MSKHRLQYKRIMQFYETDAMGIIHHANYVLLLEEARLQFLRLVSESKTGDVLKEVNYPLLSCHVDYKKPLHFNEEVVVDYTVSAEGARLVFDYILSTKTFAKPVAFGKTVHVAFDMKTKKAIKLPERVLEFIKEIRTSGNGS